MRAPDPVPDQQAILLDYVERLNQHRDGRRAIHLRLSALRPQNRREHHIRIAANTFEPLLRRFKGQIFHLRNDDLFIIVQGATVAEIDDVVLKLRFLFSDDPLCSIDESRATPHRRAFCSWYDVTVDYDELLDDVRGLARAPAGDAAPGRGPGMDVAPPAQDRRQPERRALDPTTLSRLETALRTMDLRGIVRRQPVCAIFPGAEPKPMFSELFVSISQLQKMLLPGVDLTGDRWLFQRLTEALDQRVLAILPELEERISMPTCVNINVRTLLSPEFLVFDKALRQRTQKVMIWELQSIDVFGDMGAFLFAREFVRDRGYRLALDGLSHLIFPLFDRASLGFDFQKMHWSPDIATEVQAARRQALHEAIQRVGPSRVIMCRCDSPEAIAYGQAAGITLFQGSHVDRLIQPPPTALVVPTSVHGPRNGPSHAVAPHP